MCEIMERLNTEAREYPFRTIVLFFNCLHITMFCEYKTSIPEADPYPI